MARTARPRSHNEWFRPVSLGGRKSCPSCPAKLGPGESVWSWGEYVNGKWRTVDHFCRECFPRNVRRRLSGHTDTCGCEVNLVGYHTSLPAWLTLED